MLISVCSVLKVCIVWNSDVCGSTNLKLLRCYSLTVIHLCLLVFASVQYHHTVLRNIFLSLLFLPSSSPFFERSVSKYTDNPLGLYAIYVSIPSSIPGDPLFYRLNFNTSVLSCRILQCVVFPVLNSFHLKYLQ